MSDGEGEEGGRTKAEMLGKTNEIILQEGERYIYHENEKDAYAKAKRRSA